MSETDKAKEYRQNYYQKNKKKWAEKYNGETIVCPVCGAKVRRCNYIRHQRSKKHQRALAEKQQKDIFEHIIADEKNLKEFMEKVATKIKSMQEKDKQLSE